MCADECADECVEELRVRPLTVALLGLRMQTRRGGLRCVPPPLWLRGLGGRVVATVWGEIGCARACWGAVWGAGARADPFYPCI